MSVCLKTVIITHSPKGVLTYPYRTQSSCCAPGNDDLGGEVNFLSRFDKIGFEKKIFGIFVSGPGEFFCYLERHAKIQNHK